MPSVLLGFWEFGEGFQKGDHVKYLQAFVLSVWIVVPPIWFWFEFFYLYKKENPKPDLDEFKHGQDQSSKIWLALVTVLLGMYFGRDLIREPSEKQPNPPLEQTQQTQLAPQPAPLRARPSPASAAQAPRSVSSGSPHKPPAGHP